MTLHVSPAGVIACHVAFDDALRLVVDRDFWGQAAMAYRELGHLEDAQICVRHALEAERQLVAHANAALSGAFA